MKSSGEYDLLSEICTRYISHRLNPERRFEEQFVIEGESPWRALITQAETHAVRPIFYQAILHEWLIVAPAHRDQLAEICRQIVFFNLSQKRELDSISRELKDRGIDIIPFKGILLTEQIYGDIGMREMGDIDLLLSPTDLQAAYQYLVERGYSAKKPLPDHLLSWYHKYNCEYNFDFYRDGVRLYHVDPHWELRPPMLGWRLGYEDISTFISDEHLMPEGLLLTTCLHHGSELMKRWKQVLGISLIMGTYHRDLDWDTLIEICEKKDILEVLLFTLDQCPPEVHSLYPERIKTLINQYVSKAARAQSISYRRRMVAINSRFFLHVDRLRFYWKLQSSTKWRVLLIFRSMRYMLLFRWLMPVIKYYDSITGLRWLPGVRGG